MAFSNYLTFIVKSTVYGGGIIGVGYVLMRTLVPSDEEMQQRLKESGRTPTPEAHRAKAALMRALEENARSDRPIWDVRGLDGVPPRK
ncbi:hypothetical protein HDU86_006750 [Geranomyces michiganensis]|nr:hypothetical protein HDU86_006750 [Geranomyces michiganensis]